MKTLVISLRRSQERRRSISNHLSHAHISFSFLDGIDGTNISPERRRELIVPERLGWTNYFRPGAIGCALSHLQAYQTLLATNESHMLILEDDARLRLPPESLKRVFQSISSDSNFDVVLLNSYSRERTTVSPSNHSLEKGIRAFVCIDEAPASSLAYVVSRSAARRMLQINTPLRCTADQWSEYLQNGVRIHLLKPDPFVPNFDQSVIDYIGSRESAVRRVIPKALLKLRRKLQYLRLARNIHVARS